MTDARHPARLEISEAVSEMERLGWPPAWGKWGADLRTDQKAEWSGGFGNFQGSANGGAQVCEFRGVVFQGESKAHSLARKVGHCGIKRVEQGQGGDDANGDHVALKFSAVAEQRAERDADHDGDSEDAHAFSGCPCDQEQSGCE